MSLNELIKTKLTESIKSRNELDRNAWRFIKGKIDLLSTQPPNDESVIKVAKSLLSDAKSYPKSFTTREIEILQSIVPTSLTEEEVAEFLESGELKDLIVACPKEGQSLGIAMKAFSAAKKNVSTDTVRDVVMRMRTDNVS